LGKPKGKDRQYIFKIEKGKVTPNIDTIAIIIKSLDITLKYFFDI
jgi:DNA-binding XRE family transcriptional regulator